MKKAISCVFNIDTACVEVQYVDGTKLSIYTPSVDREIGGTIAMQTEIDWLIYNDPVMYTNLALSGELEQYARDMASFHGIED